MRGFGGQLRTGVSASTTSVGKSAGASFGKIFAAAAALGIGAAVGGFLKDSIAQASDLAESANKIDAIFGKAGAQVQKFASGGATALGQTKLEVLNASATFGTFGKAAGLAGGDLAKFSTGFAGLSTDLASFYNTSPEQAVQAIGAALRGEAEPIRQYGVLLDDATLRAEALKLGLISTTSQALTPQQKVLAAQAAIYKQTADAQGDFQRTSGGLANQQRILKASFSDIKTEIGTALLPAATQFFTYLNTSGIPAFKSAADTVGGFLGPAFDRIGEFFSGSGGQGLSTFATAIRANLLPVVQTMANTFQTVVLPTLLQLGEYLRGQLGPVFQQVAGIITSQVLPVISSIAQFVYGRLYPALIAAVAVVAKNLQPAFEALVQYVRAAILPTISALLAKFREYQPQIEKVVLVVVKVAGALAALAAQIISFVLPKVLALQTFFISKLVPAISTAIDVIADIIGFVVDMGEKFVAAVKKVTEFQKAVIEKIDKVIGIIKGLPEDITSALGDLSGLLVDAGRDVIGGLIAGINESKEGKLLTALTGVSGFIVANKGPASYDKVMLKPAGVAIIQGLIDGMRGKLPDLGDFLASVSNLLAGGITSSETKVAEAMQRTLGKVVDVAQAQVERLRGVVDGIKSALDSLASSVSQTFSGDLFQAATGSGFFDAAVSQIRDLGKVKAALKTLRGYGLSGGFLAQLFASGNIPLILDLAAGGKEDALFADAAVRQVSRLADSLGSGVADARYGKQLDRQIEHLRSMDKKLDALAGLAKNLGREINQAAAAGQRRRSAA